MSFVTTPTRTSPASSRQSPAMRLLLPEPTGPPTPTRSARSADKEALLEGGVTGGRELEARGGGRRLRRERALVVGDRARGRGDLRGELHEPARRLRRIEPEQFQ